MNMKTIILSFLCISVASTHAMIASEDGSRVSSFFKTLRDDVKSVVSRDCNHEQKQRLIKQGAVALVAIGAAVGGTVLVWCVLRSKKGTHDDDSGGGDTNPKIIPRDDIADPSDTEKSSDEGEGAEKEDDQDKDEPLGSGDELSSGDSEDESSQASGGQSG